MLPSELTSLLERLQRGELDVAMTAERLRAMTANASTLAGQPLSVATTAAQVDVDRAQRCGFPEVVFCQGKTAAAIAEIFRTLRSFGQDVFATRASPEQARDLLSEIPDLQYNPVARTLRWPMVASELERTAAQRVGRVAVITAGTGDLPVAEEAVETARWMGCETVLIVDVGVAGPHRLPAQRQRFEQADAIVVVAGMEGALPSVVGGYVGVPVIAVPTSIGYGASFGGLAALLGMLNSCAANVTVVNIDAGFKGGYVAALIARRVAEASR